MATWDELEYREVLSKHSFVSKSEVLVYFLRLFWLHMPEFVVLYDQDGYGSIEDLGDLYSEHRGGGGEFDR